MAPRPLTANARSGRSHSKCVISRRSKRIGLLGRRCRPLVAAEVVGEDLLHDGRGEGAAPAARVLDDAGDRYLGRVEGREGDEPRVFAHHLGAAVRARSSPILTTCEVPVFPATSMPGTRAFFPVPLSLITTSRMPSRTCASVLFLKCASPSTSGSTSSTVPSGLTTRFT